MRGAFAKTRHVPTFRHVLHAGTAKEKARAYLGAVRFPIGIQDFRKLRTDGFAYVDKTRQICEIADQGGALFLARPRRFGKSLTVSTMRELYSGDRELFRGLWAYDHWDFAARQRPVIWLKFASSGFVLGDMITALHNVLDANARDLGLELPDATPEVKFSALIRAAADSTPAGRVVVLVDEYDKPINEFLTDLPRALANRDLLKPFYGVLKDADAFTDLVFLTGVSAFAKVSIFSDLNHVRDLTLERLADTVVGLTEAELYDTFGTQIEATGEDREAIRTWYNGYSWGGSARVYNPWSVMRFMQHGQVQGFWFQTGKPVWLVALMRDRGVYHIEDAQSSYAALLDFDIESIQIIPALFQTGYLTITGSSAKGKLLTLNYPNLEVREAMDGMLLEAYLPDDKELSAVRVFRLADAFRANDLQRVFDIVNATFAGLPYDFWHRDNEHFFHALVHLTFSLLGAEIDSEVHSASGRCDAIVKTDTHIYALEFKRDSPVGEALAQIRERGYLKPFVGDSRSLVAVGVSFDVVKKQVGEWLAEAY